MRLRRGFSLIELSLSIALLAVLMLVTSAALKNSQILWRQMVGSTDAEDQLRRVHAVIQRDMEMAGSQIGVTNVTASLGGGATADGSAFWCLSPLDSSGRVARKYNGTPLYQRNVLYYLIVPNNHQQVYGTTCAGGAGPGGYDDRCPHKVLVRKVIDSGTVTTSTDELTEETLMTPAQVAPYLTRPTGLSAANMNSEVGVQSVSLVGRQLLWFKVDTTPAPVQFEIRATNLLRANRTLRVGTVSLYNDPLTAELRLTLVPGNP